MPASIEQVTTQNNPMRFFTFLTEKQIGSKTTTGLKILTSPNGLFGKSRRPKSIYRCIEHYKTLEASVSPRRIMLSSLEHFTAENNQKRFFAFLTKTEKTVWTKNRDCLKILKSPEDLFGKPKWFRSIYRRSEHYKTPSVSLSSRRVIHSRAKQVTTQNNQKRFFAFLIETEKTRLVKISDWLKNLNKPEGST